ncbi:MAG: hypothetical protein GX760_01420 [Erysipelothrix sp.]|nr:hypothetical protein [Erysipelothrix sp.]
MFDPEKRRLKRAEEKAKTEEFLRLKKEANFEKGDYWALIVAAMTTILPVALLTFVAIFFFTMLFFRFFR